MNKRLFTYVAIGGMGPMEHSWQERRATTLKDIAECVGVSEATVSVVVNGARSGTRVSAATRNAVIEAATRLGYRPNGNARPLASGRSNRLGIYSGRGRLDARNLFFAELLGGMLEGSVEFRTNTVVHTSGNVYEDLLELVSSKAVDGLVVHLQREDPILQVLDELRVPAVSVADRIDKLPSICVADQEGGRLLARHLAELGHRRILIIQAFDPPQSAFDRVNALVETAHELGVKTTVAHADELGQEMLSDEDVALITRPHDGATAIVGWCDQIAERLCHTLTGLGLSIPDDVAVAGFDGFRASFASRFELATIRAPWAAVGRSAVSTLSSLIRGDAVPAVTVLPVEFVRGSTT